MRAQATVRKTEWRLPNKNSSEKSDRVLSAIASERVQSVQMIFSAGIFYNCLDDWMTRVASIEKVR